MGVTLTQKFAGDVNSTTSASNKAAATADVGTVETGSMLIVTQIGLVNGNGSEATFVTPSKSSGTATLGSWTLIGSRANGTSWSGVAATWRVPVTAGGTLVLSTDDNGATQISYGWGLIVHQVTGHDPTTPIAGYIDSGNSADATPPDVTLSATPDVSDTVYAVSSWDTDAGTKAITAGTGFTLLAEVSPDSGAYTAGGVATRTGSASTTVALPILSGYGGTIYESGHLAFIIKPDSTPVTYVASTSNFSATLSNRNSTVPTTSTGGKLVHGSGAYNEWNGSELSAPFVVENTTSDFTHLADALGNTPSNGGSGTTALIAQVDDATPSTYNFTYDGNSYGAFDAMVATTPGELQATSGGVFTSDTGSSITTFNSPAFTVDVDGSLAIMYAVAYNNVIGSPSGWTQRVSLDGGYFKVFTQGVDAGSYSAQQLSTSEIGAAIVVVLRPHGGGAPPPPDPLIPTGETSWGSNTAAVGHNASYPAHSSGDLIVQTCTVDATPYANYPSAGPNGETIVGIAQNVTPASNTQTVTAWYWIATANTTAGSLSFNLTASEQTSGETFVIPAGEFDATTPISNINTNTQSNGTTGQVVSAGFTATNADGRVVMVGGVDADPMTASYAPSGWTGLITHDQGAVSSVVAYRNALTTASESVASATFGVNAGDTTSSVVFVINPAAGGPTSHPITASGSSTSDGTATVNVTRPVTASGSSTSDGVATVNVTRPVSASGTSTSDGSAVIEVTKLMSASGSSTSDGSAAVNVTRPLSASGTSTSDGTATVNVTRPMSASGSSTSDGTATPQLLLPLTASGTSTSDGSAAINISTGAVEHQITASGTSTSDGSATLGVTRPITASGSSTSDGSAALAAVRPLTASGTSTSSGTAQIGATRPISASGTSTSDGAAAVNIIHPMSASGTSTSDGSATLTLVLGGGVEHAITAAGTSTSDGSATIACTRSMSASGTSTSDGSATIACTRRLTASGSSLSDGTAMLGLVGAPWAGSFFGTAAGFGRVRMAGGGLASVRRADGSRLGKPA